MADVKTISTRASRIGYAKQSAAGTYASPTHDLDPTDFTPTDNGNPIDFEAIRQSRNVVAEERQGVRQIGLAGTMMFSSNKGMPLWALGVGTAILSGASPLAGVIGGAIAVGDTTATITGLATPPAGINEWAGCWVEFTKSAGAIVERKFITKIAGTTYTVHTPFANTFATSDVVQIPVQNVFVEKTSPNTFDLDYFSATIEYGNLFEEQLVDGLVTQLGLRGNNRTIDVTADSRFCQLPVENAAGTTTWSKLASEKSDPPFIMMDGGLVTPFDPTDAYARMHSRLKSIEYMLTNELITDEYGGAQYQVEQYTVGARRQTAAWTEAAGQYNATPDIYVKFVRAEKIMPAYFAWVNKQNNAAFGIWLPFCSVPQFQKVTANNEVIGYSGTLMPREDPTTGRAVKMAVVNAATAVYA
jgi:hypothetical protein